MCLVLLWKSFKYADLVMIFWGKSWYAIIQNFCGNFPQKAKMFFNIDRNNIHYK